MGTTPPTHACAVRFMNFCAETKFEKGASDRNSHSGGGGRRTGKYGLIWSGLNRGQ